MKKYILLTLLTWNISPILLAQTTWERHTIDNLFSGADGVKLGDLNKDGLLDITTGWEETGITKVYIHPGFEHVKEEWPSVIVGDTPSVEDAVFTDIDNDGNLDVVSSTEGDNRKMYINWAPKNPNEFKDASKWQSDEIPIIIDSLQWMYSVPAQIDQINGVDLVVGSKGYKAQIGWFQSPKNPRNMKDWIWHPISSATWVMSLFVKDMDNDGDLDIVTSDRKPGKTNGVRWLEHPGDLKNKEWKNHFISSQGLEVMFMDMADLDQDGLEDVIVAEYTNQSIVFSKRLDNTGLHWKNYTIKIPEIAGRAKAVRIGDFNLDGNLDIALSTNTLKRDNAEGIIWMSYKQSPTEAHWEYHSVSGLEGYKYDQMELLDIDGDGDLDILTCEENFGKQSEGLGVIWYENPHIK